MKYLYFCRHGEAELNALGRWAGSSETPLTKQGIEQSKLAGQEAKDLGIDYIISSPLSRAHDTAKIIAEVIGYPVSQIDTNSLLVERHFGAFEGQPWTPDFNMDGVVDAETEDSVRERVRAILKHLKTVPAENILVVSHGHIGRVMRNEIYPHIPLNPSPSFKNAKIVKLV